MHYSVQWVPFGQPSWQCQTASQAQLDKGNKAMQREHEIVKASIFGIAGNLLLVALKLIIGFVSHSIAIILDGVNNATDVLSSVVTIVGTKLAGKRPDKAHPFGYGRVEYLSSVVIAVIILAAGLVSLRESILKIIHPGTPSYSVITITIIVVGILIKIVLGLMFKHYGDKTHSEALIASGVDSNNDAIISGGTLVVAIVQNLWSVNIDGIVGLAISFAVIKAGVDVLRDSLAPIIGTPEDKKLVASIKRYTRQFPEVHGVHDIILDNFGPHKTIGSMRIGVADTMTATQISELTRKMANGLHENFGVLVTVGIYTESTSGKDAAMHEELQELCAKEPAILNDHAFYVDDDRKTCYFDLVLDVDAKNESAAHQVVSAMEEKHPEYHFDVQVDTDYSE